MRINRSMKRADIARCGNRSGDSELYHQRQRKEAISAEIKASLDLYFGGQGKEEKQMRLAVSELILLVKSKKPP